MVFNNDILNYAEQMDCQELHCCIDSATGLKGIIAIHNTNLGPSLGGCRWLEYSSTEAAVVDAIRLAQGMTYKSALSGLKLGGGKTVLMKPKGPIDKTAYFKALGRFIENLNGRYITAVDSGTSIAEMDIIHTETKHVTSHSKGRFSHHDPSPLTAFGVCCAIQSAVKYQMKRDDLDGVHVGIQGLGHVGYHLVKLLTEKHAKITVFDINESIMQRAKDEYGVHTVKTSAELLSLPCDVLSPCALGAVLNQKTIPEIQAKMVVGAANNQLADPTDAEALWKRGILYAPDFVVNAGGIIYVAGEYFKEESEAQTTERIAKIYDTLMLIFERAEREGCTTYKIAHDIALERVHGK